MTTLATMRNRILDDLMRNDLTSQAESSIKSAIAFYENRRFWFLEQRATASTIDGQEFYGLPSDFLDEDVVSITVNNWSYPLIKRTFKTTEDWFVKANTYKGYPTDYAIYDEQIRLYPIPNGQYTMTIAYYKRLTSLTLETDSNDWLIEGEELIRSRAEWDLYARTLRDFDAAQACKVLEQENLAQHEKLTKARLMTGSTRRRRM